MLLPGGGMFTVWPLWALTQTKIVWLKQEWQGYSYAPKATEQTLVTKHRWSRFLPWSDVYLSGKSSSLWKSEKSRFITSLFLACKGMLNSTGGLPLHVRLVHSAFLNLLSLTCHAAKWIDWTVFYCTLLWKAVCSMCYIYLSVVGGSEYSL